MNKVVCPQVKMLVHLLCSTFDEPLPEELDHFIKSNDQEDSVDAMNADDSDEDTGNGSDEEAEDAYSDEDFEHSDDDEIDDDKENVSENSVTVRAKVLSLSDNAASNNGCVKFDFIYLQLNLKEMDAKNAEVIKKQTKLQYMPHQKVMLSVSMP